MSDKELSEKLLELLGGKGNVTSNAAGMTRLRVVRGSLRATPCRSCSAPAR